jgi:hypothetical protein
VSHKAEIAEIEAEAAENERAYIWAADRWHRNFDRITSLAQLDEQMSVLYYNAELLVRSEGVLAADDVRRYLKLVAQWLKMLNLQERILKAVAEDYADVPARPSAYALGLLPGQDGVPPGLVRTILCAFPSLYLCRSLHQHRNLSSRCISPTRSGGWNGRGGGWKLASNLQPARIGAKLAGGGVWFSFGPVRLGGIRSRSPGYGLPRPGVGFITSPELLPGWG